MSLFHSSVGVICADYFGDELVLPLPNVGNKKMDSNKSSNEKAAATSVESSVEEAADKTVARVQNKGTEHNHSSDHQKSSLRFSPSFDGLHCFETLILN
ncbi:hypothetical protein ACH5RR_022439 [Cinchona calisaya]|uniref:Uncharacterized protein n=1 Tax=Cinchona calisaya TaxID=153742 RepID=A0ABD2ZBQ1_9GENT